MSYKHSEKVVVGSLWKIKEPTSAYYLFDAAHKWWLDYNDDPECYEYCEIEDQILWLVKHEIKENRHHFWLLVHTWEDKPKIIKDSIPVGIWDNVFVLAKEATDT